MIADLSHLLHNLESAFFFVIPFFLCFAWGGKKLFKRNHAVDFLTLVAIIVISLRIICFFTFNRLTGRYHLPEVIVLVCFAPAGVYFAAKIIQKGLTKLKVKLSLQLIITVLMVTAITISSIKSFRITPKIFLNEFATALKPYDSADTILINFTSDGIRINARLSGAINLCELPTANRNIWEGFFYVMENFQFNYKNIFVMTEQRGNISLKDNDFEQSVRSYYMFFPFDLVKKCTYKRKAYLLYRFNYKIADGLSPGVTLNEKNPLGINLPDRFLIPAEKTNAKFDILDYCPIKFNPDNVFLNFTMRGLKGRNYLHYFEFTPEKDKGNAQAVLDIDVYNQILWPLKKDVIAVLYPNEASNVLPTPYHLNNLIPLNNAEFIPPLNLPEKIYMLPEGGAVFAESFSALPLSKFWRSSFNYEHQAASQGHINIPGNIYGAKVKLGIELKYLPLQSKNTGNITIELAPAKIANRQEKLNIFILNGNDDKDKERQSILNNTFKKYGLNTQVTSFTDITSSKEHFGYWDALTKIDLMKKSVEKHAKFFADKFDFVLIEFDHYDIHRHKLWRIRSEKEKMLNDLEKLILSVKKIFPFAKLGITINPAPVPSRCYHWFNNWFMQKLTHYSLCNGLYERFNGQQIENIYLIPLFHNIDPDEDYLKSPPAMRQKGIEYLSIMGINQKGMQKIANSKTAWIMSMLSSEGKDK